MDELLKLMETLKKSLTDLAKEGAKTLTPEAAKTATEKTEQEVAFFQKVTDTVQDLHKKFADMEKKMGTKLNVFESKETSHEFLEWFLKALASTNPKGKAATNPMVEGTDADGGVFVPDEFKPMLIRLIQVYGLVRKRATIVPIMRDSLKIPRLTQNVIISWVGENSDIDPQKPTFAFVEFIVKKMAALVPISNELLEDSEIALANLLAEIIAEAMAGEEDRVSLVGNTGAGDPFDGILHKTGTQAVNMASGDTKFSDVTVDYLIDMQGALDEPCIEGAEYCMHRTVFNYIKKLKGDDGQYIWSAPKGGDPGDINGYGYFISSKMPKATDTAPASPFVILGNFKNFYIGDRRIMTVKISDQLGFQEDVTFVRATQRESLVVAIPEAFAVLYTAAEVPAP